MMGITLIVVPFWWNGSTESLAHAIHMARPDIPVSPVLLTGDAIPTEMPSQKIEQGKHILTEN